MIEARYPTDDEERSPSLGGGQPLGRSWIRNKQNGPKPFLVQKGVQWEIWHKKYKTKRRTEAINDKAQ